MASEAEEKSYWGMNGRACDTCRGSPALIYCRADSAFLCGTCDARVHGANRVASRHERVWVCEVCEQAPAAVTCKADAAALCAACDADIHSANPLARRHERSPIVPFFDFPATKTLLFKPSDDDDDPVAVDPTAAAAEEAEAASWILPNPNPNPNHKGMEMLFGDVDPYLDFDYAAPVMDSVVPVQTKVIGGSGGAPPVLATDGCIELDFTRAKASYSSYNTTHSFSHSVILSLSLFLCSSRSMKTRMVVDLYDEIEAGIIVGGGSGAGRERERDGGCDQPLRKRREAIGGGGGDGSRGESDAVPREAQDSEVREDDPLRISQGLRRDTATDQGPLR